MKRLKRVISFLLLPFWIWAQTDTSAYEVIMNDGSRFNCKILEIKQGEYLKVMKEDSSVTSIDWPLLRDYKSMRQMAEIKAQKEKKHTDKVISKHSEWNKCLIVMLHGDTIRARIRDRNKADVFAPLDLSHGKIGADYSVTQGLLAMGKIVIAHDNETEETLSADDFLELYVPGEDPEFRKYITLDADSELPDRRIYRVITDGKCKLLFRQSEGGGFAGGGGSVSLDKYYVYYKGKLTKLMEESMVVISPKFRKKSSELFTECPELVDKINDKKYKSVDLRQIVKEFNDCIAGNNRVGKDW